MLRGTQHSSSFRNSQDAPISAILLGMMEQAEKKFLKAVELLKKGEVVAFPTETVYGLGACLFHEEAIKKIFAIKKRPSDNPLIAHIGALEDVEQLAVDIPEAFYLLSNRFWPGPLTIVLKRRSNVPRLASAGQPTIAIRMPAHPLALRLIRAVGAPLVAPSANLSGRPSPTLAADVREDLKDDALLILDGGECSIGIESTVISLITSSPVILRPGSVSQQDLESALGMPIRLVTEKDPIYSPGMKHRHYAPQAKVRVILRLEEIPSDSAHLISSEPFASALLFNRRNFYSRLREADRLGVAEITIYCGPSVQEDAGLMNRVFRSAGLL
jgi:L-threonylcarbamoyladenylate synthase